MCIRDRGDDDADPAKARVCAALHALTASGVAAFIIHGNRDFLLGREFCQRTGCELLVDPSIVRLLEPIERHTRSQHLDET